MSNTLPTAAEMRAEYDEPQSVFSFGCYARLKWPALIAMREELDRLRKITAEAIGGPVSDFEHLLASERMARQRIIDLERQLAACQTDLQNAVTTACEDVAKLEHQLADSRAECERLRREIDVRGHYAEYGEDAK